MASQPNRTAGGGLPRARPTAEAPQALTPQQELSNLLTTEQLGDLAFLISTVTDCMRQRIVDSFSLSSQSRSDTTVPGPQSPKVVAQSQQSGQRSQFSYDETPGVQNERRVRKRRERELSGNDLSDLQNDALEYFQTWRDSIVSEILTSMSSKQPDKTGQSEDKTHEKPEPKRENSKLSVGSRNLSYSDQTLLELYPPSTTSLSSLPRAKRISILSVMLILVLSKGHYVAYSRILLLHLASSFELPFSTLGQDEAKIAQGLLTVAKQMTADEEARKRAEASKGSQRWKIGLAGVGGALLIGVTGGLATPLVAGAMGGLLGGLGLGSTVAAGLLGTLSSSGIIVAGLFGAYGYDKTSKMMEQYAKEVEDFAFLPLKGIDSSKAGTRGQYAGSKYSNTYIRDTPDEDKRLRITIGISGWLTEAEDFTTPWLVLSGQQNEVYTLRWELEALRSMGNALQSIVSSAVWTVASSTIIAQTALASLMFALWPIGLLKLSKIVDNPFTVAKNRADKAGLVLADAIIAKAQGDRPVTLVGYSMGARLIYSCLMSLAERRAFGLVESAVLIGSPAPSDASVWKAIRSVVAGRLVNVYSTQDNVLAFLYRTSSIQYGIAGLQEIKEVSGVENVDVSEIVSGHLRYKYLVGSILQKIGWEDVDLAEVGKKNEVIEMLDREDEHRVRKQQQEVRKMPLAEEDLIDFGDDDSNLNTPTLPQRPEVPQNRSVNSDLMSLLDSNDEATKPVSDSKDGSLFTSSTKQKSRNADLMGSLFGSEYPIAQSSVPKKQLQSSQVLRKPERAMRTKTTPEAVEPVAKEATSLSQKKESISHPTKPVNNSVSPPKNDLQKQLDSKIQDNDDEDIVWGEHPGIIMMDGSEDEDDM